MRILTIAILALTLAACGDDPTEPDPEPEPAALTIAAGDGQTARIDSTLADPLAVRVDDQFGDAFGGALVRWRVMSGGGTVEPATTESAADGLAETAWTLGETEGEQTAIAFLAGVDTVTFVATGEPPPPPFDVSVDNEVREFAVDSTGASECRYTITASATGGEADAYAEWLDGQREWRKDGAIYQTDTLSTNELVDYFGANRLHTGEAQEAHRFASWVGEFVLVYTFRYEVNSGERRSTATFVPCETP